MKKIVSFSLEPETIRKMDRLSKALGVSRSEFVEQVFGTVKMSEAKLKRIEAMQRELTVDECARALAKRRCMDE